MKIGYPPEHESGLLLNKHSIAMRSIGPGGWRSRLGMPGSVLWVSVPILMTCHNAISLPISCQPSLDTQAFIFIRTKSESGKKVGVNPSVWMLLHMMWCTAALGRKEGPGLTDRSVRSNQGVHKSLPRPASLGQKHISSGLLPDYCNLSIKKAKKHYQTIL